jgi:hypothetical protein
VRTRLNRLCSNATALTRFDSLLASLRDYEEKKGELLADFFGSKYATKKISNGTPLFYFRFDIKNKGTMGVLVPSQAGNGGMRGQCTLLNGSLYAAGLTYSLMMNANTFINAYNEGE